MREKNTTPSLLLYESFLNSAADVLTKLEASHCLNKFKHLRNQIKSGVVVNETMILKEHPFQLLVKSSSETEHEILNNQSRRNLCTNEEMSEDTGDLKKHYRTNSLDICYRELQMPLDKKGQTKSKNSSVEENSIEDQRDVSNFSPIQKTALVPLLNIPTKADRQEKKRLKKILRMGEASKDEE